MGENSVLPSYATEGSSGLDLFCCEDILINPFQRVKIKTGISVSIPPGFEIQIRPRSGVSFKTRLTVFFGTVDWDYRGEIMVTVENSGPMAFQMNKGLKIAQAVLAPIFRIDWQVVESLDETKRGDGGYGSTGEALQFLADQAQELDMGYKTNEYEPVNKSVDGSDRTDK